MFKVVDKDTVLITWRPPGPDWERAAVGRDGVPRRWYEAELPEVWHDRWDLDDGPEPDWTGAYLEFDEVVLTNDTLKLKRSIALDRDALQLPYPDLSEPNEAVLLPGRTVVLVGIASCPHVALLDYRTGEVSLMPLPGTGSAMPVEIRDGGLWLTHYETLVRLDLATLTVKASEPLQPKRLDPTRRIQVPGGYIGRPVHVPERGGYLVPRPYSGDVLLIDEQTLAPTARIATGGRPYALHLFDDGAIVIADDGFDRFQTTRIEALTPL